jgi:biotin transport system substrate-specific component
LEAVLKSPWTVHTLALIALWTALTILGAYVRLPIGPVPVVLTNLFIITGGALLGPKAGLAFTGLYLLLGAAGLPVFSGGGGAALFAGPTGGFLLSYPLQALLPGLIIAGHKPRRIRDLLGILGATLIVYPGGILWLGHVYHLSLSRAIALGLLPFIPGDILKGAAVFFLLGRLRRSLPDLFPPSQPSPQPPPQPPAQGSG